MRVARLDQMTRGWWVGDFEPAVLRTALFETALHRHAAGEVGVAHRHNRSLEYNLIVMGAMEVNGVLLGDDDIFVFEPGEVSRVRFLADTTLVVVRTPSLPDDKELVDG